MRRTTTSIARQRAGKSGVASVRKGGVAWNARVAAMDRYMARAFQKMDAEGLLTSAHNKGHADRVATYAAAYIEAMGGGKKQQAMGRIVGKAHDRFRDPVDSLDKTRKIEHPERAAIFFKPIFEKRYSRKVTDKMIQAILKHDSFPALNEVGKNLVRDGVVYADKFFEANGAYVGFRRSMFMGERVKAEAVPGKKEDAMKQLVRESRWDLGNPNDLQKAAVACTIMESKLRIEKFSNMDTIPLHMRPFVQYQVKWQHELVAALEAGDKGMTNLVTKMFANGLQPRPHDLEEMIRAYQPIAESDGAFKHEAMRYLNGELAVTFKQLTKRNAA